mmetsp:Transcript_33280/g.83635  ORF Transcript_33280/g.83635 Transcript_33280/m.83635 type:complete len:385 (+) Transcript_33280:98-1252(+)
MPQVEVGGYEPLVSELTEKQGKRSSSDGSYSPVQHHSSSEEVADPNHVGVSIVQSTSYQVITYPQKSLCIAFLLWLPPFGFFGMHRFYLRSYPIGIIFLFTLGGGGLSWLLDLFRLPSLRNECNNTPVGESLPISIADTYLLQVNPVMGLLGMVRMYVRSYGFGVTFLFTGGYAGLGWLYDFVRIYYVARAAQRDPPTVQNFANQRSLADAYLLMLPPLGLLGIQRFYLRSYLIGVVYFCTLSLFGLGYLFDIFYLSCLYRQKSENPQGRTRVVIVQTTTTHDPRNPHLITTTTETTETTGDAIRGGHVRLPVSVPAYQGRYQSNQLYTVAPTSPPTLPSSPPPQAATFIEPPPLHQPAYEVSDNDSNNQYDHTQYDHTSIKVV